MNAALLDYANGDRSNQLTVSGGVPSTTFDAWNFFLNKQTGFTDFPDYSAITGQQQPNVPMTFGQYWQLISPWLTNSHGLKGLDGLGQDFAYLVPPDYVGSGMGQLLGMAGAVNSMYQTPRNRFWPNPRTWGLWSSRALPAISVWERFPRTALVIQGARGIRSRRLPSPL
jgi:hypothetical protein